MFFSHTKSGSAWMSARSLRLLSLSPSAACINLSITFDEINTSRNYARRSAIMWTSPEWGISVQSDHDNVASSWSLIYIKLRRMPPLWSFSGDPVVFGWRRLSNLRNVKIHRNNVVIWYLYSKQPLAWSCQKRLTLDCELPQTSSAFSDEDIDK